MRQQIVIAEILAMKTMILPAPPPALPPLLLILSQDPVTPISMVLV